MLDDVCWNTLSPPHSACIANGLVSMISRGEEARLARTANGGSLLRRIDHIAIAVRDTDTALDYFCGRLGLKVAHTDVLDAPPVVLTYLDVGNAYLQLIAPRLENSELARWLDEHGEGLHHVCFSVDDVPTAAVALSSAHLSRILLGQGRGRRSAFVADGTPHGVTIEVTEWWPTVDGDHHAS